jgi:hypothetical protein
VSEPRWNLPRIWHVLRTSQHRISSSLRAPGGFKSLFSVCQGFKGLPQARQATGQGKVVVVVKFVCMMTQEEEKGEKGT